MHLLLPEQRMFVCTQPAISYLLLHRLIKSIWAYMLNYQWLHLSVFYMWPSGKSNSIIFKLLHLGYDAGPTIKWHFWARSGVYLICWYKLIMLNGSGRLLHCKEFMTCPLATAGTCFFFFFFSLCITILNILSVKVRAPTMGLKSTFWPMRPKCHLLIEYIYLDSFFFLSRGHYYLVFD